MYICICMCIYIYIYVHISLYMYVRTPVDVIEGPYHPLRFGRIGCCFYKSENTESDVYTASPYGLVDLQLPHSFDRRYHIPLSVSVTVVHPPQVVLSYTPTLRTYCWSSTNNKDANLTSLLSVPHQQLPPWCLTLLQQIHTFWLWTDPHQTHTQRSPKARSPTCKHITTRSQTNHSQMDVLPAHLIRDSFRDSLKGTVALETILDLPFGFPRNNIISQSNQWTRDFIFLPKDFSTDVWKYIRM